MPEPHDATQADDVTRGSGAPSPEDAARDADAQGAAREQTADGSDYKRSFVALKDSVKQGRSIRKRERELRQLTDRLAKDRLVHEDMTNILENFDDVVGEQRRRLEVLEAGMKDKQEQLSDAKDDLKRATAELKDVREENRASLEALKEGCNTRLSALEQAHAQAKERRRGMQAQLDAAQEESESSVAFDLEALQRKLELLRVAEREAKDALDDAKTAARQAQRDKKQECEDREHPLAEQVDRLKAEVRRLDAEIEVGKEDRASVEKRIGYCEDLRAHPERADDLAADIAQMEDAALRSRAEIDAMNQEHAVIRSSAGKAKRAVILGVVAVVVIVVAIVLIVMSMG